MPGLRRDVPTFNNFVILPSIFLSTCYIHPLLSYPLLKAKIPSILPYWSVFIKQSSWLKFPFIAAGFSKALIKHLHTQKLPLPLPGNGSFLFYVLYYLYDYLYVLNYISTRYASKAAYMALTAFSKSSFSTPTMMFISLEPWSIILILMFSFSRAPKSCAAVPFLDDIP